MPEREGERGQATGGVNSHSLEHSFVFSSYQLTRGKRTSFLTWSILAVNSFQGGIIRHSPDRALETPSEGIPWHY